MSIKYSDGICPNCGFDEKNHQLSPHHLPVRTILNGKYLIGRVLGEGGFGITYLGWDLNLDLKIAIKEYYPTGFVTRENTTTNTVTPFTGEKNQFFQSGREKFIEEAKRLAKFYSLPGIVSIKDFFLENGTAYIVMEYVDGETFKQYLASMGGKIPAEQMFEMMKPLMKSLIEIHKVGIIHRDISPDNIMITKEGNIKLLDFGAARDFADSGNKSLSVMLKPGYAPEEQYRSRGVQGPWTDIYALCATMYKAITGATPDESSERLRHDELKKPSELGIRILLQQEAVLMKGMAVFQEERFQSISELSSVLYNTTNQETISPILTYSATKPAQSNVDSQPKSEFNTKPNHELNKEAKHELNIETKHESNIEPKHELYIEPQARHNYKPVTFLRKKVLIGVVCVAMLIIVSVKVYLDVTNDLVTLPSATGGTSESEDSFSESVDSLSESVDSLSDPVDSLSDPIDSSSEVTSSASSSTDDDFTSEEDKYIEATITINTYIGDPLISILQQVIEEEFPNVTVNVETMDYLLYSDFIEVKAASGELGDIFLVSLEDDNDSSISSIASYGDCFADLSDINNLQSLTESYMQMKSYNGKQCVIPCNTSWGYAISNWSTNLPLSKKIINSLYDETSDFYIALKENVEISIAAPKYGGMSQFYAGNTSGNIANGGYVVQQDDWIYFSKYTEDGCLYKINIDGSQKTKLSSDQCSDMAIAVDWLYYENESDYSKLYRMKTDGSQNTKLDDMEGCNYINVVGDWIYYLSVVDNYSTYKMKADGSEKTKIEGNIMDGAIQLLNGEIFYIDDWQ